MQRPRVLITNLALGKPTGTEAYVRDLAPQLLARGWRPIVYSPRLGETAEALRRATVPVVERLDQLSLAPDVIHGHHSGPTMAALARFPDSPAIFFCHDWSAWHDQPFPHPRVRRYVAVDETCRDRLECLGGIDPARVVVHKNWADLARFRPRGPLPERPRRALAFSNAARGDRRSDPLRRACEAQGITLDAIGLSAGKSLDRPEEALGGYDLVFAKGKSAIEALAVGCAVVLCGFDRVGPLVTSDRYELLREQNFGRRAIDRHATEGAVRAELARYDPVDASRVTERLRGECDLPDAVDRLARLYDAVIREHRVAPATSPEAEGRAVAAYLEQTREMTELGAGRLRRQRLHAEAANSGFRAMARRLLRRAA